MHIYTRFNPIQACILAQLDIEGYPQQEARMNEIRVDESWLRDRLVLFERYTYPSIMNQTDQDFEWVGLVHKDSPQWFISEFDRFPRIRIELVDKDTDIGNPGDSTVNLDSDDALADQFVELAKRYLDHRVLYFVNGLKFDTRSEVYIRWESGKNPFNVVPAGDLTVLDRGHGSWPGAQRLEHLTPMWLQIIHGDNIANRLRKPSKSKALDYRTQVRPFFKGE